ncbi:MAG: hypothetical protein D4S01_08725, partial [Dehalococcoidia bacterium]
MPLETFTGNAPIFQGIGDQAEMCDRRATCLLTPHYEDLRKYWTWPDLVLTSGFFTVALPFDESAGPGDPGEYNVPAWFYLSLDPNTYQVPMLPMLDTEGEPATAGDLIVYLNGFKITNAIASVDPWNGIIGLTFIPPFNSKIRIDYYHSGRYPKPQYYMEEIISDAQLEQDNDMIGQFNVIGEGGVRRLYWPYAITDISLYGDDRDYQVNKFPILTQQGTLATKEDIDVFVGVIQVSGTLEILEVIEEGEDKGTILKVLDADLTPAQDGDTLIIEAPNYLDNTLIYVIQEVN